MHRNWLLVILIIVLSIAACGKAAIDRFTGFVQPANFPQPAYHFATNPVTREGFELGRKLFYDPIISSNGTISCSSCHIQTSAFTHHGHSVSHGIFDRLGTRNSPPVMNLAWSTSFMWDGGVADLDLQPIVPITSHVEMDDSVANVLARLRSSTVYQGLFRKAFGTDEITTAQFLKALSQFMVMCVSSNSKYDQVMRKETTFSDEEQEGYRLFGEKCGSCHREPLFTDQSFRNNGLSLSEAHDQGRYAVTLHDTDRYKFKVPSLRNLSFTPPYMHDGRFFTVSAVLDHYTDQVKETPNLDPIFMETGRPGIPMTTEEKSKVLAFLLTLDDRDFVTNKKLAEQ